MDEAGDTKSTTVNPPKSISRVEYLVVDSVAFIKQPSLQDYGQNICSVGEIVPEIRDEASRNRLSFLPYKLDFRQPDNESLKTVADFARKSGDFGALSITDLKLIALTLMLTKEIEGNSRCIRTAPPDSSTVSGSPFAASGAVQLAGFHRPSKPKQDAEKIDCDIAVENGSHVGIEPESEAHSNRPMPDKTPENFSHNVPEVIQQHPASSEESSDTDDSDNESGDSAVDSEELDDVEDNDDGDWITPDNLHEAIGKMSIAFNDGAATQVENAPLVRVACMTADYAMQNVLIQMGLSVVSVDGMLIRRLRQWALRCYGCFHVTNDFSRKFCPKCGNMTLKRVAYTIDEQGNRKYFISSRRTLNLRGTKYSLPTPHGGKHPKFPILREDQRQAQNRPTRKALQKVNPLDENYIVRDSPFAYIDLTSRAARLGNTGHNKSKHGDAVRRRNAQEPGLPDRRKNPNEARRKRK